jgi:hypothetical protein
VFGQGEADVLLPGAEGVDPVVERSDLLHGHRNPVSYRFMPVFRRRSPCR